MLKFVFEETFLFFLSFAFVNTPLFAVEDAPFIPAEDPDSLFCITWKFLELALLDRSINARVVPVVLVLDLFVFLGIFRRCLVVGAVLLIICVYKLKYGIQDTFIIRSLLILHMGH